MEFLQVYETLDTAELSMVKLVFNKNGVEYRTRFENTLQVEVYALSSGGAVVEVADDDLELAIDSLREIGIEVNYNVKDNQFEFMEQFDEFSKKIPILNRLELGYRFLVVAATLLIGLFLLVLYFSL